MTRTFSRLRKLEQRAQRLSMQLMDLKDQWQEEMDHIKSTDMEGWLDYCDRVGISPYYKFEDVLA